jgi:hypothetical protein
LYEEGDVTVLWNQAVHTDREVTANRPDIITKNKKVEKMHTDRCGNTWRQKCCAKGRGKEVKIQEFRYRDTTNVEPEMFDYTSNNWSHWNCTALTPKQKGGSFCKFCRTFGKCKNGQPVLSSIIAVHETRCLQKDQMQGREAQTRLPGRRSLVPRLRGGGGGC